MSLKMGPEDSQRGSRGDEKYVHVLLILDGI